LDKIPHRQNLGNAEKARLQLIVGEEVSQFLERNNLTDKALRDFEGNLQNLLIDEGFLKDERRHVYQTLSPSKLEKRQENHAVQYKEISKVMSDRELGPVTKR
jgi:hypothetical protein